MPGALRRRALVVVLYGALHASAALAQLAPAVEDFTFLTAPAAPSPTQGVLLGLASTGKDIVAVGERGLIIVGDAASGWRQASVPVSATLTAVEFVDSDYGWAVGHAGVILASEDGGLTWRRQFDGREVNQHFYDWARERLATLEAEMALLPADAPDREEREYALEDAQFALEDAERALETGPADPFLDVHFLDRQRGFAVGAYGLLFRTDDGGEKWRIAIDSLDNPQRYHYYAIHERDGVLYLSGEAGLLFISRDNGEQWQRIEGLYEGSFFGLVDLGVSVATFGLRGNVFASDDGGESWERVPVPQGASLYGASSLKDGAAVFVGSGGTVLRLDASGNSVIYGHPERASFAAALAVGDTVYLAGMAGIAFLVEAAPQ